MDKTSSAANDPSIHLKNLMQAGQQSAKQFDDALALAMGVAGSSSTTADASASPITLIAQMQQEFLSRWFRFWAENLIHLMTLGTGPSFESASGDRRFKDMAWQEAPYYDLLKQSYLLGSKQLKDFVDQAQVDDKAKLQLRFYARQFIDAISPSNFPATNPDVIRTAIQTRSASLVAGMQNFIEDVQKGRITRVDEGAFEVGGNLAITPGCVVFENELIQLIEYAPVTAEVQKTPLLFVPPCINKYYLLDLGKGNSLVEYAVAQGHRVFLISGEARSQRRST